MATIVEYSSSKRAVNAYPRKIVSPLSPTRCCPSSTELVGEPQEERGWPFVYQRCAVCGFTVRRFASREEVLEGMRIWKKTGKATLTADAA